MAFETAPLCSTRTSLNPGRTTIRNFTFTCPVVASTISGACGIPPISIVVFPPSDSGDNPSTQTVSQPSSPVPTSPPRQEMPSCTLSSRNSFEIGGRSTKNSWDSDHPCAPIFTRATCRPAKRPGGSRTLTSSPSGRTEAANGATPVAEPRHPTNTKVAGIPLWRMKNFGRGWRGY